MKSTNLIGTFEETAIYQEMYDSLISVCDTKGTMVLQDRLLETDKDIPPHLFFRKGTREYVFPKQNVSLSSDKSQVIDPTPGYTLKTEEQIFNFNEKLVKGRIKIEYEDANNRPIFKVSDLLKNSEIPVSVIKTLDNIFKT